MMRTGPLLINKRKSKYQIMVANAGPHLFALRNNTHVISPSLCLAYLLTCYKQHPVSLLHAVTLEQ